MPSAQVIDLNPLPRTEETTLEKTLSGFSKRHRENQIEKQETDALRDIYSQYQQDGKNLENAMINVQTQQGLSPTTRVNTFKQLLEFQKHNNELQKKAREDSDKDKKKQSNQDMITDIEKRRGLPAGSGAAYVDNPAAFEKITKPEKAKATPKGAKEKFDETLAHEGAKEVPKLEQAIAKANDTLTNIKTIEDLAENNLSGLKGYLKAGLNTEAASQLKTLGATNLDTVIKLFNPAGTLPTAKLNWIRDTFSVSPWDTLSTIKGKLNTQKIIANQSVARAKERLKLLKEHNGNIPSHIQEKFDSETSSLLDVLQDQYSPKKEEKTQERPGFVKIKDPQGIERWVPEQIARQMQG